MGDPTRGGPPHDDPEATQIGAPPEDVIGETADTLSAADEVTREAWSAGGAPEPTRVQTVYTASSSGQASPGAAARGAGRVPSGWSRAPSGGAGARPRRRRRARLNLPRLIAPIIFLAAVIAVLSIAIDSGVIGGKGSKTPAATTGKSTTKASSSPVVKVRKFYRVKAGDTLSVIAEKFHTTENQLMIINDLSTTTLRVGQRLKLPSPAP